MARETVSRLRTQPTIEEQTMTDPRETYTAPASPEAISTVHTAANTPSGEFADGDGYSSVAPA